MPLSGGLRRCSRIWTRPLRCAMRPGCTSGTRSTSASPPFRSPVLAPQEIYEAKAQRWRGEWPGLIVEPWPAISGGRRRAAPQ